MSAPNPTGSTPIPAILVPADFNKPVRQVDIADPHDFRALADLIGCTWLEYVRTPIEGVWMVVNEEGLYADGAQVNRRVSGILYPGRIVGDVLIVGIAATPDWAWPL